MKPRILHLYKDYYPPVLGGIEETINVMANGLSDQFDQTVLVCSGNKQYRSTQENGVHVHYAAECARLASTPVSFSYISKLRELIRNCDIVHLHHPNPLGDLALMLSLNRHIPVVMTYHSDIVRQKYLKLVISPLQYLTMKRCAVIMPTSPNYIESSRWLQKFRNKLEIVSLGIRLEEFRETELSRKYTRTLLDKAQGRRIICFNGRLRYYKGLPWLLDAMTNVSNAVLFISGDGPMRQSLEEQIQKLKLYDRVHLLGTLSHDELVGLLHAADVFCMPSHLRAEALGLSIIEAMTCGLPIVSCDIPTGVKFVNVDNVTGLVVPPCDSAAIAAALTAILNNEKQRQSMSSAAKERANRLFSADIMNRHIAQVYSKVLMLNKSR